MTIEEHISELLYEHDCVIIPGLGGFVGNFSSARIHSSGRQILPPFKKISFNINLRENDGLLVHRIALKENISYHEAARRVLDFATRITRSLEMQKRFELKNIGLLFLGEEEKLLFRQDETVNYLSDSFGMYRLQILPVVRETIERKTERKHKDKIIVPLPSEEKKEPVSARGKIYYARHLAAGVLLLLAGALAVISLQTNWMRQVNFAELNPFAEKEKPLYFPAEQNLSLLHNPEITAAEKILSDTAEEFISFSFPGNTTSVTVRMEKENEAPVSADEKNFSKPKRFHIIGGAFEIRDNAERLLTKMKNNGYDAHILKKGKRLLCVAYGSFSSRQEALALLFKVRAEEPKAWLWKK